MFGSFGCGMMGPVSHPGPPRKSAGLYGLATLEMMIVELSCCAPYSLYGNVLSVHTP